MMKDAITAEKHEKTRTYLLKKLKDVKNNYAGLQSAASLEAIHEALLYVVSEGTEIPESMIRAQQEAIEAGVIAQRQQEENERWRKLAGRELKTADIGDYRVKFIVNPSNAHIQYGEKHNTFRIFVGKDTTGKEVVNFSVIEEARSLIQKLTSKGEKTNPKFIATQLPVIVLAGGSTCTIMIHAERKQR